jgi:hypothetical protein
MSLVLPTRSVQAQTSTEYTLITGVAALMIIGINEQVRLTSDPSLWSPKRSVQVLREKLYQRAYNDLANDTQEMKDDVDAAIASNTRIPELRGQLQAIQGSISGEVHTRPGNTVGPTGQGVENLLNDEATRAQWNQNLSGLRTNVAEALRILTNAESRGFCGDRICQSTEDCLSCPADCGIDACVIDGGGQ